MREPLLLATSNPGKGEEFRRLLSSLPLTLIDLKEAGLEEYRVEEDGKTFSANAWKKALFYSRLFPGPVVADDSGLLVPRLGGFPGVHSARIAPTVQERNLLLLQKASSLKGPDREALFRTSLALAWKGRKIALFHGEVRGRLLEEPSGEGGFGYDPLFYYHPLRKSFAQAEGESKNRVSHRGRAVEALLRFLLVHPYPWDL